MNFSGIPRSQGFKIFYRKYYRDYPYRAARKCMVSRGSLIFCNGIENSKFSVILVLFLYAVKITLSFVKIKVIINKILKVCHCMLEMRRKVIYAL
ncbi:hypothetical protein IMSAGC018_01322 [Lachnospiraceae bacterium]|nr:hypothetical protein IMSAGC018_01322 [Lachnospiraceae bacterium]